MEEEPVNLASPVVRQVQCRSVLGASGICDYAVNCYTGCTHGCAYCYARFMGRFHHPGLSWGSFVDVKINAPEVLARQVSKPQLFKPGSVFLSSVCDAYQPLEEKFALTRQCLGLLVAAGYQVHVQTKSSLVRRDFDLLSRPNATLCLTVTTADAALAKQTEPQASPPAERLAVLREARAAGIRTKAFVGPLLPGLSDTQEQLAATFAALAGLGLEEIYVDRLNLRWGVWPALKSVLADISPAASAATREILFNDHRGRAYNRWLRMTVQKAAQSARLDVAANLLF